MTRTMLQFASIALKYEQPRFQAPKLSVQVIMDAKPDLFLNGQRVEGGQAIAQFMTRLKQGAISTAAMTKLLTQALEQVLKQSNIAKVSALSDMEGQASFRQQQSYVDGRGRTLEEHYNHLRDKGWFQALQQAQPKVSEDGRTVSFELHQPLKLAR